MASEPTLRPLVGLEELARFCQLDYVLNDELEDDLKAGRRRPDWMWMALEDDRVLARLAWWTATTGAEPHLLDVFDFDERLAGQQGIEVGARLFEVAIAATLSGVARPPDYSRFIPSDWRATAAARCSVEDRMSALERTGARLLVERLRLEWQSGTPIVPQSGRLHFRSVESRGELVDLLGLLLIGTLDAYSRQDLADGTAAQVASAQYDEFASYDSPQNWWRIATLAGGEPVGLVIPARNAYNPIVAYIGVAPAYRGDGYVDDLLAEGTRILAAAGASRIRAATDLANVPMARAFERAGYVNFERSISMTWRG